ncbi:tetratricopeptide repeat protein [Motiliproteus sediminis]|uniref:tetratricopeptide repeat protein n=1 Tax=Motiliproteus sediminis TaxID=1468178 RepID=UPI001AEF8D7A|nr:sel1 repeat family protein [Motiliproteus sediminis]
MSIKRTLTAFTLVAAAASATFVAEATTGQPAVPSAPQPEKVRLPASPSQLPPVLPFCDALCRDQGRQLAETSCYSARHGLAGDGVNYPQALESCAAAAAAGDSHAQTLMGELNFLGLGAAQNFAAAADWYSRAAAQGHPHAQLMMYEMTRLQLAPGVTQASEWLSKAVAAGHPQAVALQTRI